MWYENKTGFTDIDNELMVTYQRGKEGRKNDNFGEVTSAELKVRPVLTKCELGPLSLKSPHPKTMTGKRVLRTNSTIEPHASFFF